MSYRTVAIALSLIILAQAIPMAYTFEGVYTDGCEQTSIGTECAMIHICNNVGDIDAPLFTSAPVRCIFDGNKYSLEETILSDDCHIFTVGEGVLQGYRVSVISDVPIQFSLSESPNAGIVYTDVPTDGSETLVPVTDVSGAFAEPKMGHIYYLHIRVPTAEDFGKEVKGNVDVKIQILADILCHQASYRVENTILVTSEVASIIVESEGGVVTDGGMVEGHTVAGVWADESMKDCVGIGENTLCGLSVADGTQFCIQFSANIGGWGWFGKIDLTFVVSYDDDLGHHEYTKTLTRTDYQGTKVDGYIGMKNSGTAIYTSLSELDQQNAWFSSPSAYNIQVSISGMVSEWTDTLRGYALANIIIF